MFNYLLECKLFTECQSGFSPGDSYISELISITHGIYKSFDYNPSVHVRRTFLDISKAFDKVWHDGSIYKLKSYGVEYKLLNRIQIYLANSSLYKWLTGGLKSIY